MRAKVLKWLVKAALWLGKNPEVVGSVIGAVRKEKEEKAPSA